MAVVGSLLGVRLLTELLDPVTYGELALSLTAASLINQTILGPLSNGVTRFYAPAVEQANIGFFLSAVSDLVLSATWIIVLIILLTVTGLLIIGRAEWTAIAIAVFVFAIFSGYNLILSGIQNAARQRSIVALHQGLESWIRFLITAALLLLLGANSAVAMVGYIIAAMLLLGSQYVFFRKTVPPYVSEAYDRRNWSEKIWKYSWPFAAWGIFIWAQQASDRWALELCTTGQEVGFYAVLFQLGYYPMSMVTGMAVQLLAPIFFQHVGDATDVRRNSDVNDLSWRLTWFALGVTCVVFLITFFVHAQIFRVLVAREYSAVSNFLPWMLLAGGVFAAGQTIALNLMSQMKTQSMVVAKVFTAILGVVFNFTGAYWYGIKGIVMAGNLFSVTYFLWMVALSKNAENARIRLLDNDDICA